MSFGENLKRIRTNKKENQEFLAKVIGISRQAIAGYESGKREPSFAILIKIADYYDVSLDYLLGRIDSSESQHGNIIKKNILRLMKNMTTVDFARDIGDKTGILIPIEKIELFVSGKDLPDSITLKIIAMYAGVDVNYFYKEETNSTL